MACLLQQPATQTFACFIVKLEEKYVCKSCAEFIVALLPVGSWHLTGGKLLCSNMGSFRNMLYLPAVFHLFCRQ